MTDLLFAAADIVGESIVFDERRNALVWVDIGGRRIHRLWLGGNHHEVWPAPELPTCIGLCANGQAIVGLTQRVALWDFGGDFRTLAIPEPDRPDHRLNEGRVAPDGSFWVGTMQNNLDEDGKPRETEGARGTAYRIDPDGAVTRLTTDLFGIPNTMAWPADGVFLIADTVANATYRYDVSVDARRLSGRRAFGEPFPRGLPDGSCLDSENHLWTARVAGGACVTRTRPDGSLERVVDLPCTWPTSCTFGGPDYETLFITSARFTMSAEHLSANPQEGSALKPGVAGRLQQRFRRPA
jgi:sugar lactone lactonase YvrE